MKDHRLIGTPVSVVRTSASIVKASIIMTGAPATLTRAPVTFIETSASWTRCSAFKEPAGTEIAGKPLSNTGYVGIVLFFTHARLHFFYL